VLNQDPVARLSSGKNSSPASAPSTTTRLSRMRSSVGGCVLLIGFATTGACGRQPLDEPPESPSASGGSTGASGQAGGGGTAGAGGRAPAEHRATAAACVPLDPLAGPRICDVPGQGPSDLPAQCNSDGDCNAGRNGRCEAVGAASKACACVYDDCLFDADCPGGGLCACNPIEIGNRCVTGTCRVDQDCGVGGICGPVSGGCSPAIVSYQCHTSTDTCIGDGDCPPEDTCDAYPGEGWACRQPVICRG
jgi:hypothetical protein